MNLGGDPSYPPEDKVNFQNTAEQKRLDEAGDRGVPWIQWGPYRSERQWGTVREDYSENGDAWSYLTHDQARARITGARTALPGLATTSAAVFCAGAVEWQGPDPKRAAVRPHQQ